MWIARLRRIEHCALRALGPALLFFLVGDLNALAAPSGPQQPQPPCNNQPSQSSPYRCSQKVHDALKEQVDGYCKVKNQEMSCNMQNDTCESAGKKVSLGYGCTNSRELMQQQCYKPGDAGYKGHMIAIKQAYQALRSCLTVQTEKCQ